MNNEHITINILGNRIQSAVLIFGMTCILALIGFVLGHWVGVIVSVAICIMMVLFGPSVSPQLVLRMYKAQEIPRQAAPELLGIFDELVRRAQLKVAPKLYYVPSRTLNAFAVGNEANSAVAITDGLLRILNPREIAGVLAHEVAISDIATCECWELPIACLDSRARFRSLDRSCCSLRSLRSL